MVFAHGITFLFKFVKTGQQKVHEVIDFEITTMHTVPGGPEDCMSNMLWPDTGILDFTFQSFLSHLL
jgi:hypothetical protein